MKWLGDKKPRTWDCRIIVRFCLLPRAVKKNGDSECKTWFWLEKIRIVQQYNEYPHFGESHWTDYRLAVIGEHIVDGQLATR